jgi:hypothetical protein
MDHYTVWLGIAATERPLPPEQFLGIAAGAGRDTPFS